MSFTSLWYFPSLFAVAGVCYFLNSRIRIWFLLAVSWIIYAMFGPAHFLMLVFVTGVSYGGGLLLRVRSKASPYVLAAGIMIILGMLFYMKYFDMFALWGRALLSLGRDLTFTERNVVLPVGISFYTFQSLSYLIDVYRGGRAERNFVVYALYISFFPQLVAGPIEQADHLLPQLKSGRPAAGDLSAGISYLLSGCVRKFVIADYMAGFADAAYGNIAGHSGIDLAAATVCFAIQIYCDFSGYTHIAIGSARILGIRLTENFDRPYLAAGCRDFWRRWHITLTKWFTEYVYIPLGGNRKGQARKCIYIMVVFLLSGLWHGADLTFVCWGAFFGVWRIAEEFVKNRGAAFGTAMWLKRTATFGMVCFSWILFRSPGILEAGEVMRRIFTLQGGFSLFMSMEEIAGAAVRIGLLILLPGLTEAWATEERGIVKRCYTAVVILFTTAVCVILAYSNGGESSFIYFQF